MKYKRDTPTDMNEQFNQIMAWLLIQNTRLNIITTIKLKLLRGLTEIHTKQGYCNLINRKWIRKKIFM